ncbi:MAG: GTP-binding protein [Candidatus Lokiarchaeota archaeon]|nr:GTP-binding protein [Candidatus Lokiarchaeota archaeon]
MKDALFKVCIFGQGGVGKTCLVNRYLTGLFKEGSTMTIGVDFLLKKLEIDDIIVELQIWDFAGEERFRFLLPRYARGAAGGIFMFDLTRMASLKNVQEWLNIFKDNAEATDQEDIPMIMVGGKLDLKDKRSVDREYALNIVDQFKFKDYFECSAKTGDNVEIIFERIARILTKDLNEI